MINPVASQQQQLQQQYNSQSNENEDQEQYLASFQAAIDSLQQIIENPSSSTRMNGNQNSEQLKILLEKYGKIEQMVSQEQKQIDSLLSIHSSLQQELFDEYSAHQQIISQGKQDILNLSIMNKQAIAYQNKGQQALSIKQQEAEILVQRIIKIQNEIQEANLLIQEKSHIEKSIDEDNQRYQQTIDEFKRDQNEQKEGLEEQKQRILNGEKEIKLVKKEQIDMQKKLEQVKHEFSEIKQQTAICINARDVAFQELKNEKRTLQSNERKLEEIQEGLRTIESEIEKNSDQLQRIRQVNDNFKKRVNLVQSSLKTAQQQGNDSEELQTLETILQQYTALCADKQKIIESKEQEKQLIEEHLSQLNIFAQQYLEKQNQEQLHEDDEYQGEQENHEQDEEEEIHNQHQLQSNNNYAMECIQSQYDQEQDSLTSPHLNNFNIKSNNQSKQSETSSSVNYQSFPEQKPQQDQNQQLREKKEERGQRQDKYRNQDNSEEGKVIQISNRSDQNHQGAGQQIYENHQRHQALPSDSQKLNVQKYSMEGDSHDYEESIHKKYDSSQSFGQGPVQSAGDKIDNINQQEDFYDDFQNDSEQQKIVDYFNQEGIQDDQEGIAKYLLLQEQIKNQSAARQQQQGKQSQSGLKSSPQQEDQKLALKMNLQGRGYNQIFNQLKNNIVLQDKK